MATTDSKGKLLHDRLDSYRQAVTVLTQHLTGIRKLHAGMRALRPAVPAPAGHRWRDCARARASAYML